MIDTPIHDAETDEETHLSPQHSQLQSQGEKKTTSKQRLTKISVSGHPNIISPVKCFFFFFGLFSIFLFLFVRLSRGLCRLIANHVYARRRRAVHPRRALVKRLRRTADSGLCWPASERRVSADVRSKQKAARLGKSEERQIDVAVPYTSLSPRHPQDSQTPRATKWTSVADPRLFYTGVVPLA